MPRSLLKLLLPAACFAAASIAAPALAADCALAIEQTAFVAEQGRKAFNSWNYVQSAEFGSAARIPAIDALQLAKACGCNEAVAPLTQAIIAAQRANLAFNLDNGQQYGARIAKEADLALDALRRCSAK